MKSLFSKVEVKEKTPVEEKVEEKAEEKKSPSLFIAPGLISKIKEKYDESQEQATQRLIKEAKKIVQLYSDGDAIAFFDDVHKCSMQIIAANQMAEEKLWKEIVSDLNICENVFIKLKSILSKSYNAESKSAFVTLLSDFYNSLELSSYKNALKGILATCKNFIQYAPATPTTNDKHVMTIIEKAKNSIPDWVAEDKKQAFQISRIDLIMSTLVSLDEKQEKLKTVS